MTGLPIIDIDDPGKIQFCHVRYQKKDKINSKWLKNLKSNKKWNIIARDEWCFYPIAIYPKSYSIEPKDQKYVFVAEYRSKKNGDRECYYSDRIETSFDGSILEWASNNEHDPLTSLPKFPKSMLAKINRCLANNFLPDLWAGQGYAKWHRMDERIYRYMLTYDYESKPYIEPLLSLLRSDYGSAAAILLAFTCFSVAKPFFPRYRSLDKTSCYLQAKKYIPRQISINIKCDSPDVAIQLADLCCGCFRTNELHEMSSNRRRRKKPVIDGVVIQLPHKKMSLTIDSFEAAVLQPASVLWVNRRPVPKLVESGKIIDIAIPHNTPKVEIKPFALDLIADWTTNISMITLTGYHDMVKSDWDKSAPELDKMLTELTDIIIRYGVNFSGEVMEEAHTALKDSSRKEDTFTFFKNLKSKIENDFEWIVEHYGKRENNPILAAEAQIEEVFARYQKVIKKNRKQNIMEHLSFESRYEEIVSQMKADPKCSGIDPGIIEKMAYLYTSFRFFVRMCIPKENRKEVFSIFENALDGLLARYKLSPQVILEQYIKGLLTEEKHYARIRGKESDRPDIRVWYDTQEEVFLLPKKTYFSDLQQRSIQALTITKWQWEDQLADGGLILSVKRGNQNRRSFEVNLKKGNAPRQAALKVPLSALSNEFRTDTVVTTAIKRMEEDPTKLRSRAKPLSAGK